MFSAGQQIGPYKLSKLLGRGGFGEVWLAERKTAILTTKVAVKLPVRESVDLETVRQEAEVWEKASGHPNVMPIIEANIYDGQIVIVSEYASDGSLADLLRRERKLSVEKSVEIMGGILSGLEFLHSRKIIHRDLKPANVLLQGATPRLADFGISRALRTTELSQTQNIAGTFEFMAPEAFDGKRNVQTDIWSAGITLYKLLSGNLPFPQLDTMALIGAIITRDPEPLPDSIPQNLQDVVLCALSKNPYERYESAEKMREALQKSLTQTKTKPNYEFATFKQYEPSTDDSVTKVKTYEPPQPSFIKRMFERFMWSAGFVFFAIIFIGSMSWYLSKNSNRNSPNINNQNIYTPEIESSPIPISTPPPLPTVRDINFKKFTFPLSQELKDSGITQRDLKILNITFGDLDGNKSEEVAVLVSWSFVRSGGNGSGFLCYVFRMNNMRLEMVSNIDLGSKNSNNLWDIKQSIQKSQLYLTGCYLDDTGSYIITKKYKIVKNDLTFLDEKVTNKECQ